MPWSKPKIREICLCQEINGYMPSEF
ncbi:pyrroloquinoline quinone precursor peptide PqqA [Limobrevibacterium gyesilva]